jgi:hypothetical protein
MPGTAAKLRSDFKPSEFDAAITTKGYRMYWSRAGICPCLNNDQTEQADPTCPLCKGRGYYYYLPDLEVKDGSRVDFYGNPVELNEVEDGVSIFVLKTALTADVQVFEKFGEWVFGATRASVQWQNRIGYRDRLVERDSFMIWNQVVECDGGPLIKVTGGISKAGLRYPCLELISFRSVVAEYREDRDVTITPRGELEWTASGSGPPAAGTRLSLAMTIHPVWIVMDHVHVIRDSQVEFKTTSKAEVFEKGRLPIQSMLKLDFLVEPGNSAV